ncbi:DUF4153 domain-containing protein [Stutzerimonas stutzeri]|uniref:DUF4153 domain-containing protein n=1 Tax=Stutzerimonas sp. S1 TaxID=3030652 RepID=UPI002224DFEB|nr:DUF4153 domain-containing protein [Stutzerimonas sp. S1]MCW3147515.1 DUF4153 domain-containing protein [Stutzerimonas sp. S1]
MQQTAEARPLKAYLAVGLLQGLALWAAGEAWPHATGWRVLCSALLAFTVIGGWQVQLLWGGLREAGRWRLVVAAAVLPAVLAGGLALQFDQPRWYYLDETTGTLLLWSNLILAYVLTPFIQARDVEHRWRVDYTGLYRHAINNGLLLFMALLMLAAFWLLIWLWAGLFKLVGIGIFATLFESSGFIWIASATVVAIGLWIGLERGLVVDALRNVLQAMCRFLLPLTVLILLLFVACLPFTGLQPLWQTRHATPILLAMLFAHVALLNGVVQDGRQGVHYPRPLRVLIDASALCLPLLAGLAVHALWLRIGQYGLTPERVIAAGLTLVALLHALALMVAVLRRRDGWLAGLRQSNPVLALVSVALLLLLHLPPLSPLQLSAANQYQRLLDEQVPAEHTDLGALRFQLGQPGRDHLEKLRQRLAQPGLADARREQLQVDLQRLDRADNYWNWRHEHDMANTAPVPWIGEPLEDVDGVLAQAIATQGCDGDCALFAVDLDADSQPEVLLLRGTRPRVVTLLGRGADGSWRWIGHLRSADEQTLDSETLKEQIERGAWRVVAPRFNALEIDGLRLEPAITE